MEEPWDDIDDILNQPGNGDSGTERLVRQPWSPEQDDAGCLPQGHYIADSNAEESQEPVGILTDAITLGRSERFLLSLFRATLTNLNRLGRSSSKSLTPLDKLLQTHQHAASAETNNEPSPATRESPQSSGTGKHSSPVSAGSVDIEVCGMGNILAKKETKVAHPMASFQHYSFKCVGDSDHANQPRRKLRTSAETRRINTPRSPSPGNGDALLSNAGLAEEQKAIYGKGSGSSQTLPTGLDIDWDVKRVVAKRKRGPQFEYKVRWEST